MVLHRILYVDLSSGSTRIEELPDLLVRGYLGARGVNSALLYEMTDLGLDPMGPDNPLLFGAGLLTGMPGPAASRLTVTGKSPETGLLGDANIGGEFGSALAGVGIRHLCIMGRAKLPVYVHLEKTGDGPQATVLDAAEIWGLDTFDAQERLKEAHGEKTQVACIGPAGENLVRFACIIHGRKNAAGRTGMGCLMGSKKLKAVVVTGYGSVEPSDPDSFREVTREINAGMRKEFLMDDLSRYGTPHLYNVINNNIEMGRAYNGLSTVLTDKGDLKPETLESTYYVKKGGCRHCPVACRHTYVIKDGPHAGLSGEGPEYGVMGHMGPVLGIKSTESVLVLNDRLNRLGLDASSSGNIIGWAIEMFTDGHITESDTGGRRLGWDMPEMVESLLSDIAYRRGFGDMLADGAKSLVERFGEEAAKRMIWVKGLPQSDPVDIRFIKAFALGVATATRGADHLRSRCPWEAFEYDSKFLEGIYGGPVESDPLSYKGKGRVITWWESYLAVFDALGLCKLLAFHTLPDPGVFGFDVFARLINHGAGIELTPKEVLEAGFAITDVERRFICREGVTRKDDYPPERYFQPLKWQAGLDDVTRATWLDREAYDEMLTEYYTCHGWDPATGVPS